MSCLALDSICSDVPPPGDGNLNRRYRRPRINEALRAMKLGDSCLIAKCDYGGMYARAVSLGIRIAIRKENADCYRVWKLAG
jgi:hypothetical protein